MDNAPIKKVAIESLNPELEKPKNKRDGDINHAIQAQMLDSERVILKSLTNGGKVS